MAIVKKQERISEGRASKLPGKYAKKYPNKVPAVKLARLAVSNYR